MHHPLLATAASLLTAVSAAAQLPPIYRHDTIPVRTGLPVGWRLQPSAINDTGVIAGEVLGPLLGVAAYWHPMQGVVILRSSNPQFYESRLVGINQRGIAVGYDVINLVKPRFAQPFWVDTNTGVRTFFSDPRVTGSIPGAINDRDQVTMNNRLLGNLVSNGPITSPTWTALSIPPTWSPGVPYLNAAGVVAMSYQSPTENGIALATAAGTVSILQRSPSGGIFVWSINASAEVLFQDGGAMRVWDRGAVTPLPGRWGARNPFVPARLNDLGQLAQFGGASWSRDGFVQYMQKGRFVRLAALVSDDIADRVGIDVPVVSDHGTFLTQDQTWLQSARIEFYALAPTTDRILALHIDPVLVDMFDERRVFEFGSDLTFTVLGGDPAQPTAVFLLDVLGNPVSPPLFQGMLDASGEASFQLTRNAIPSHVRGTGHFMAFALNRGGGVRQSVRRDLRFQ